MLRADLGTLSLVEVEDAAAIAGALFEKHFRQRIPSFPRHFVLVDRARGPDRAIGYVHHTRDGDAYLAGGLVVAALEFRRLDAETTERVRAEGGLAEWIMRTSCAWLDDVDAVFAYMGDKQSIRVNLRVGFVATGFPHLHVLWKRPASDEARAALVARIAARGPF